MGMERHDVAGGLPQAGVVWWALCHRMSNHHTSSRRVKWHLGSAAQVCSLFGASRALRSTHAEAARVEAAAANLTPPVRPAGDG